jgi:hypothetical protein
MQKPPALPAAPKEYDAVYIDKLARALTLYLTQVAADGDQIYTVDAAITALSADVAALDADVGALDAAKVPRTSITGSAVLPVGTTAQRDGTPAAGYTRLNSTLNQWEGYDGTAWTSIGGGGATGAGGDEVFMLGDTHMTTSYTIPTDKNAVVAGPLTIDAGAVLTVTAGSRVTVV